MPDASNTLPMTYPLHNDCCREGVFQICRGWCGCLSTKWHHIHIWTHPTTLAMLTSCYLTTSCSFPQHAAIIPTICFFSQLASMLYTTNIQTRLKPCSCKKASKDSCEGLQIPYIGRNTSHALWFRQSSTFQPKAMLQVGFDECWSPASLAMNVWSRELILVASLRLPQNLTCSICSLGPQLGHPSTLVSVKLCINQGLVWPVARSVLISAVLPFPSSCLDRVFVQHLDCKVSEHGVIANQKVSLVSLTLQGFQANLQT